MRMTTLRSGFWGSLLLVSWSHCHVTFMILQFMYSLMQVWMKQLPWMILLEELRYKLILNVGYLPFTLPNYNPLSHSRQMIQIRKILDWSGIDWPTRLLHWSLWRSKPEYSISTRTWMNSGVEYLPFSRPQLSIIVGTIHLPPQRMCQSGCVWIGSRTIEVVTYVVA